MRNFNANEVTMLVSAGCWAQDWSNIWISDDFVGLDRILNVRFYGHIQLHGFEANDVELAKGFYVNAGLRNAVLCDCAVGQDSLIENVSGLMRGYDIGSRAIIHSVGTMDVDQESGSSFGNGVEVAVLDETGSRSVIIYDQLSAQMAYMMAVGGYVDRLGDTIREKIHDYADSKKSRRGSIGVGARVANVQSIRNLNIGEYAVVDGALRLENGTIDSCVDSTTYVGSGVVAKDFILKQGARVDSGASLCSVFVGQSSVLAQGFTAHDCVFLSNCAMENGEACAVLAGPFAVSMHKSTLLIGMMTSFSNFGSASNQSNHLYKLGPIHFGILERGTKLSSNSYIMFPAHVGAFSVVIGSHYSHIDSAILPYSYIVKGKDGRSRVLPARNLVTSGTMRDLAKWPQRDKRSQDSSKHSDLLTFDVLNPYLVERILNAREFLSIHQDSNEIKGDWNFILKGECYITPKDIHAGIDLYNMALINYVGDKLFRLLIGNEITISKLLNSIQDARPWSNFNGGDSWEQSFDWVDMGGAVFNRRFIDELSLNLKDANFTLSDFREMLVSKAGESIDSDELDFLFGVANYTIINILGLDVFDKNTLKLLLDAWYDSKNRYFSMVESDALKEFQQPFMKVGFASDRHSGAYVDMDFKNTRGDSGDNSFIGSLKDLKNNCYEQYQKLVKYLDVSN